MINIIYILPSEKGPAGGIKVSIQHSEIINKLKEQFTSQILFIKKKKTSKWKSSFSKIIKTKPKKFNGWKFNETVIDKKNKQSWFKNKIEFKSDFNFDKKKDFVILPEIFAHFARDLLNKDKINYAIFVQNGLALNFTNDYKSLEQAYSKAKFILSVSSHINNCIKVAFPNHKNKIIQINQSVKQQKLNFNAKTKLITYMPRKLPDHSKLVLFFLRNHLPKGWKILPIDNISQENVFKYLKKSKIFLSFSNLEGFGLPPLEAATLGNVVIGYTGEGGAEYWHNPIFKKIEQGNILDFVKKINIIINKKLNYASIRNHRKKLLKKYSPTNEKKKIVKMLNIIKRIYN